MPNNYLPIPEEERDAYQASRLERSSNGKGALDAFGSAGDDVATISAGKPIRYVPQPTGQLQEILPPSGAPNFVQRSGSKVIEDPLTGEPYIPDSASPYGYTSAYDQAKQSTVKGDIVANVPGYGRRVIGRDPVAQEKEETKAKAAALADQYRAEGRPFYVSKVDGLPKPKHRPGEWEAIQAAKEEKKASGEEAKRAALLTADPSIKKRPDKEIKALKEEAEAGDAMLAAKADPANPAVAAALQKAEQAKAILAQEENAKEIKQQLATQAWEARLRRDAPDLWKERQKAKLADMPREELQKTIPTLQAQIQEKVAATTERAAQLRDKQAVFESEYKAVEEQEAKQRTIGINAAQLAKFAAEKERINFSANQWLGENQDLLEEIKVGQADVENETELANEAITTHNAKVKAERTDTLEKLKAVPQTAPIADKLAKLDSEYEQRIAQWEAQYPDNQTPAAQAGYKAIDEEFKAKNQEAATEAEQALQKVPAKKVEQPDKPFFDLGNTVDAIGDVIKGITVTVPAAYRQLREGLVRPDQYSPEAKAAFAAADAYSQEMQAKTAALQAQGKSDSVSESFREAGPSLGFTGVSLGASMLGGAGTGVVAGSVVPGLGNTTGAIVGAVGGAAASAPTAYRMAGAGFLDGAFKKIEAEKGRPLTEQEMAEAYDVLLPIAQNTALWEAGPEAVANAVTLGAGKFVFGFGKKAAKEIAESAFKTAVKKAGAIVGAQASELGTETITQVEQAADQLKADAIAKGAPTKGIRPDWSPSGVVKSFKEVAPQTLALGALTGGAGGAAKLATNLLPSGKNAETQTQDEAAPESATAESGPYSQLPEIRAAADEAVKMWQPDVTTLPTQFQPTLDKDGVEVPAEYNPKSAAETLVRVARGEPLVEMDSDAQLKNVGLENRGGKIVPQKGFGAPFVTMEGPKGDQPVITEAGMQFLKSDEALSPAIAAIGLSPQDRRKQINAIPKENEDSKSLIQATDKSAISPSAPNSTSNRTGSELVGGLDRENGSTMETNPNKIGNDSAQTSKSQDSSNNKQLARPPLGQAPPAQRKAIGKGAAGQSSYAEFATPDDAEAFTYAADLARYNNNSKKVSDNDRAQAAQSARDKLARIAERTGLSAEELRPILKRYSEAIRQTAKRKKQGESFQAPTFEEFTDTSLDIAKEPIDLFHGGLPEDATLDQIDLDRAGSQQNKRNRSYGGFYLTDGSSREWSDKYAKQRGAAVHRVRLKAGSRIRSTQENIDRLSERQRAELAKKYDAVRGVDTLGRAQWVLLNKNAVESFEVVSEKAAEPAKATQPKAPHQIFRAAVEASTELTATQREAGLRTAKAIARWAPIFAKAGFSVKAGQVRGSGISYSPSARLITIDPVNFSIDLAKSKSPKAQEARIQAVFREELLHGLIRDNLGIAKPIEWWRSLSPEAQAISIKLYDGRFDTASIPDPDSAEESNRADEFVRQLFQESFWSEVTEVAGKNLNVMAELRRIFEELLVALKAIRQTAPKAVAAEINAAERLIRARLTELGALEKEAEVIASTPINEASRIREDLPEAAPIIAEIDALTKLSEERHSELGPDLKGLVHPSELLTPEEKQRVYDLKMSLRPKSREEAKADIMKKRAARLQQPNQAPENTSTSSSGVLGTITDSGSVTTVKVRDLAKANHGDFREIASNEDFTKDFRYNDTTKEVFWWNLDKITPEDKQKVSDWLEAQGKTVARHRGVKSSDETYRRAHGALSAPVNSPDKPLAVVHNLSIANLRHALKVGGLPVPSLAVIRADLSGFDSFGEVTLIANPDLIDPQKNKASKVFNADVYSPRYPTVKILFKPSDFNKIASAFKPWSEELKTIPKLGYSWSVESAVDSIKDDGYERSGNNPLVGYSYLRDKGLIDPPTAEDGNSSFNEAVYRKARDYRDEITSWVEEKILAAGVEPVEKIFDGFTNSGNKRYLPHDLDTVVKILKRGLKDGEGFNYGVPSIRAANAKPFRTLKAIQESRNHIVTKDEMEELKKEVNEEFVKLAEHALSIRSSKPRFGGLDAISDDMKALAKGGSTNITYLREMYPDSDIFNEMRTFLDKLRHLPTEYFESKIQRAVYLNEFGAAVVPDSTPEDLQATLKKRGLSVVTYPEKDGVARKQAVLQAAQERGALFAPGNFATPENDSPEEIERANAINETAQADIDTLTEAVDGFLAASENAGDEAQDYANANLPRPPIMEEMVARAETKPGTYITPDALGGTSTPQRIRTSLIQWLANQNSEVRPREVLAQEAETFLAAPGGEQALMLEMLDAANEQRPITDAMQVAWQVLQPKLYKRAVATGSARLMREHDALAYAYKEIGTETARSLAARRDPNQTPTERFREAIRNIARTPTNRALIRQIDETQTPSAKARKVKALERKLADELTKAQTNSEEIRSLQKELADERRKPDKADVIARMAVDAQKRTDAVLAKLGLSEYDVMLDNEDRYAAMKSQPVMQAMEGLSVQDKAIVTQLMEGNSHRAIMQKTGASLQHIGALHEQFRNKLEAQLKTFLGAQGNTLMTMIEQGQAAIRDGRAAGRNIKGELSDPAVQKAMTQANRDAIMRSLAWLLPTARSVNSGNLKPVTVVISKVGPTGQKVQKVTLHVPYDPENASQAYRIAREMQAAQSTKYDKAYEYWINGILSGPQTQFVNTAGNLVSTAWHYGYQRPVEGLMNMVMRDPGGVQMGEQGRLISALRPALAEAYTNAIQAFSTEADTLRSIYLDQPIEINAKDGTIDKIGGAPRAANKGAIGRTIRLPGRLLRATDAFFKTAIARIEVGALAYRQGLADGLNGAALEQFVQSEINTYGSQSWHKALATAEILTFQEDSWLAKAGESIVRGRGAEQIQKKASKLRQQGKIDEADVMENTAKALDIFVAKPLAFLFPFVRTPANIMLTGIRKSPIGSLGVLLNIMNGLYQQTANGVPFFKTYKKAALAKHLTEQLAAFTALTTLWGMSEGDDDDDEKTVLLVGGIPYDPSRKGEQAFRNRTTGGNYVIITRDSNGKETRFAYGRYEPIATVLGTIIDGIRAVKNMQKAQSVGAIKGANPSDAVVAIAANFMSQVDDKTFLQGFSDLSRTVQDIKSGRISGEEAHTKTAKSILTSLVPNIVRQPLRNWDDTMRDGRYKAEFWYPAWPVAAKAQPMMDIYGREIGKDGNAAARLLMPFANAPLEVAPADEIIRGFIRNNPDEDNARYFAPLDKGDFYVLNGKQKVPLTTPKQRAVFERYAGNLWQQKQAAIASKLPRQLWKNPPSSTVEELQKAKTQAFRTARETLGRPGILESLSSR